MLDRNMMLVGVTALFASVTMAPTAAFADGPFISLLIGGANVEDVVVEDAEEGDIDVEYDTGVAFAGQFGYKFNQFRLGGELGFQLSEGLSDNNVNSDVNITRFTLNGYVDIPVATNFGPYIGGGFGVANLSTDDDFEDDDTAFTWHGEVGLNLGLSDHLFVAPVYRYQWIDSDLGGQSEPLISHVFGVSLRYQFHGGSHSGDYSEPRNDRYDSGYRGYNTYDRYERDDYYDGYDRRRGRGHHHHRKKPEKTPEELERDRCGWKGPGCEDENGG